jgi:hypothetical protein
MQAKAIKMTKKTFGSVELALFVAAALPACDWRVYDDLKEELWVDSQGRPTGVDSSEFADQVLGVVPEGDGLSIMTLGRNQESLVELRYDSTGTPQKTLLPKDRSLSETVELGNSFNFGQYQPFAREPGTGRVVFTAVTEGVNVAGDEIGDFKFVVMSRGADNNDNEFLKQDAAYAPTSLEAPLSGRQPTQSVAFAGSDHFVAARSNLIMLADATGVPAANHELTGCTLPAGEGVFAVAFGDVGTFIDPLTTLEYPDVVPGGDIVALIAPMNATFEPTGLGRIVVVVGGFSEDPGEASCVFADGAELAEVPAAVGSELIITDFGAGDGPRVVSTFVGVSGELRVVDMSTSPPTSDEPVSVVNLGAVEIADLDGEAPDEVILGVPTADTDDITRSGRVDVYDASITDLIMTLREAEPEAEKRFGTSVTTAPFVVDGEAQNVLVVSASGEVFTYFRTALYDDVRVGR